jgi:hypothetical protein
MPISIDDRLAVKTSNCRERQSADPHPQRRQSHFGRTSAKLGKSRTPFAIWRQLSFRCSSHLQPEAQSLV